MADILMSLLALLVGLAVAAIPLLIMVFGGEN